MKNDKIAMQIQNNPNELFITKNVKDCFKKDKDRIPHNILKTKPTNVLKSL